MNNFWKALINGLFSWLLLRLYEVIFVFVISFFWWAIFKNFDGSLMEKISWRFREIYLIWSVFSLIFFYWVTSFLAVIIYTYKNKFLNLQFINASVYVIHSTVVLFIINFFSFEGGINLVLDSILIWISIAVFNYFSPKLLPKKLKEALLAKT